jgi:hypothetical protein
VIGILAIVIAALFMRLSDDGSSAAGQWAHEACSTCQSPQAES